jgi:ubiquitin-conjugating enzyme E2 E
MLNDVQEVAAEPGGLSLQKCKPIDTKAIISQNIKRIQKELVEMTVDPPANCAAEPEESLFNWKASIAGPKQTPYQNGIFNLSIKFPEEYPFKPPIVKFKTKLYHCNVGNEGEICLDILTKSWSPALKISQVLLSICSLLSDPNPYDPLNAAVAELYLNNKEEHDKIAREWTKLYAK